MKFTKMHGAGNDYVYINCFEEQVEDPETLAREVSDRNFGIGSDGLILILPSGRADIRMRMYNADGSEAEMCGNGIRCVAKYAFDHNLVSSTAIEVETKAGILPLQAFPGESGKISSVRVNMGPPKLNQDDIPMHGPEGNEAINVPLEVAGETFSVSCISMGNPHCVIFMDSLDGFPVEYFGPEIENHSWFPERINVEFVQVISAGEVIQRTWERGAGETLACGTGAAAVTAAGVLTGRTDRRIQNHLLGGALDMEWSEDNNIYMTGPATEVFQGNYNPA